MNLLGVIPNAVRDLQLNCRFLALLGVTGLALVATPADAQRRRGGFYGGDPNEFWVPPDFRGNTPYDGRFTFARIKYRGYGHFQGEGPGWAHDYPRAEEHLMRIIREITAIRPFVESSLATGGNILALDDPELMKYPIAYLSEPGGWHPNEKEEAALRNYLLKGGFMILDDFGFDMGEWAEVQAIFQRALPKLRIQRIPDNHPIFDAFFKIDINTLDGGGGNYGRVEWHGIFQDNDPKKRLMVVINLNGDIGEYWQHSDRGFNIAPTNEAYKLGVNYLVYALTH
jgi:hypothetical protein